MSISDPELNSKSVVYQGWRRISGNAFTAEDDGFILVSYNPPNGSTTSTITLQDDTLGMNVGAGMSQYGARICFDSPAISGHQYTANNSAGSGTMSMYYMPLHSS